jgi:hypothetical protein
MASGASLIAIGVLMWGLGYFLPNAILGARSPENPKWSFRNPLGEAICRVLGPVLIILGLIAMIGAAISN